ncbi:hypothetical protein GOBAR_AA08999 [Gossypium barbadense]|uniref:Uncharacterized protein n=1 Tax=Gossypium barbadense TaxID=3634 RepID=A0A2P5Y7Y9_GOSBA|nr:hypothetical protein GOBAR_AA08999 [Gossypium barbadense]
MPVKICATLAGCRLRAEFLFSSASERGFGRWGCDFGSSSSSPSVDCDPYILNFHHPSFDLGISGIGFVVVGAGSCVGTDDVLVSLALGFKGGCHDLLYGNVAASPLLRTNMACHGS